MSNVKTGDLAWWMVDDEFGSWPTCTVGKRAFGGEVIQRSDGPSKVAQVTPGMIVWLCEFPKPVVIGWKGSEKIYASIVPIIDSYLKKILDGNNKLSGTDIGLELWKITPIDLPELLKTKKEKV